MRDPRPLHVPHSGSSPSSRGKPCGDLPAPVTEAETSRIENALSLVLMAGIGFLPIVIAAGFLSEHREAPSASREVFAAALRGSIDADRHDSADDHPLDPGSERPSVRVRSGF